MTNKFSGFLNNISCITKMPAVKIAKTVKCHIWQFLEIILKLRYNYSMQCIGTNNIHFI